MNKRQFLGILGGGTIVAATGAGVWSATREPTKALAPWTEAGSAYDEPRRRALSYAILAPNPHNRQPWLVDLGEPDRVTLYVDTNRLLPHTDPYNRQITIGLGCFIELLTLAAAEDGVSLEVLDLRSLSPLDMGPVLESVRRTGRCVVVHEAVVTLGLGAELAARVSEHAFHSLEAPVLRVGAFDTPYPPSRIEEEYLPDLDRVLDAVDRCLAF